MPDEHDHHEIFMVLLFPVLTNLPCKAFRFICCVFVCVLTGTSCNYLTIWSTVNFLHTKHNGPSSRRYLQASLQKDLIELLADISECYSNIFLSLFRLVFSLLFLWHFVCMVTPEKKSFDRLQRILGKTKAYHMLSIFEVFIQVSPVTDISDDCIT